MSNERCGLILEGNILVEIENIHPDPENFVMMPEAEMHQSGIIGTWHTHPNTSPNLSLEDYKWFSDYPDLNHYIVGKFETWRYYVENNALLVDHYADHLLPRLPSGDAT